MIPKRIFTIWLNKNNYIPEMVRRCIESRQLSGYEQRFITLDNCIKGVKHIDDSIYQNLYVRRFPKWAETVDYLRCYYLYNEGGIYLDTDVEVLPNKNFDYLLDNEMFAGIDVYGYIHNGVIGAEKGSPKLKEFMDEVEQRWGIREEDIVRVVNILWSEQYKKWNKENPKIKILPSDVFTSYYSDHTNITNNSLTFHYFMLSWMNIYPDWAELNTSLK